MHRMSHDWDITLMSKVLKLLKILKFLLFKMERDLIIFQQLSLLLLLLLLLLILMFIISLKNRNKVIGAEQLITLHNWRDYRQGLLDPVVLSTSTCLQMRAPEEASGISSCLLVSLLTGLSNGFAHQWCWCFLLFSFMASSHQRSETPRPPLGLYHGTEAALWPIWLFCPRRIQEERRRTWLKNICFFCTVLSN